MPNSAYMVSNGTPIWTMAGIRTYSSKVAVFAGPNLARAAWYSSMKAVATVPAVAGSDMRSVHQFFAASHALAPVAMLRGHRRLPVRVRSRVLHQRAEFGIGLERDAGDRLHRVHRRDPTALRHPCRAPVTEGGGSTRSPQANDDGDDTCASRPGKEL